MTLSEEELLDRLEAVQDPLNDDDIVSLGLVNDVDIEDGTARISLAFNSPHAPAEMEIGDEIRDVVSEAGLDPELSAETGDKLDAEADVLPGVKNVIAVASGKGGVGKTTVAANLAAGLSERGARVGLLDADVHGPNVPRVLPVEGQPEMTEDESIIPPTSESGVAVMSMDHLTREEDDPAILRGAMVNQIMMSFIDDPQWGALDYMIVDLPPGTGDASLNLLQTLPVNGVVIVTTPQEMAVLDARKGLNLFEEHDTPVLGVVENMSTFHCPSCGDDHEVFGREGGDEIRDDFDVPLLAKLPVHPDFDSERIDGPVVTTPESEIRDEVQSLVDDIADRIGEINRRRVDEGTSGSAGTDTSPHVPDR